MEKNFDFEIFILKYVLKHSESILSNKIDQNFLTYSFFLHFWPKNHVFEVFVPKKFFSKKVFAHRVKNYISKTLSYNTHFYLESSQSYHYLKFLRLLLLLIHHHLQSPVAGPKNRGRHSQSPGTFGARQLTRLLHASEPISFRSQGNVLKKPSFRSRATITGYWPLLRFQANRKRLWESGALWSIKHLILDKRLYLEKIQISNFRFKIRTVEHICLENSKCPVTK